MSQNLAYNYENFEQENEFLEDMLRGLSRRQKTLPCKYFYDEYGSKLFEQITQLPEYYLTRTELGIMETNSGAIADLAGPRCLLIEYGSGSSRKTRLLLDALQELSGYVPIDISRDHLLEAAAAIEHDYPGLEVMPVCADYVQPLAIPEGHRPSRRRLVYFPGSTIGNFEQNDALAFLKRVRGVCGNKGALVIGADLLKDRDVLLAAYNDAAGVTADFNKNILRRANEELGADFDLEAFRHESRFNELRSRIEMHLVSLRDQEVHLGGAVIRFRRGESIHTENSHKYTLEGLQAIARAAGFRIAKTWTDERHYFSVSFADAI